MKSDKRILALFSISVCMTMSCNNPDKGKPASPPGIPIDVAGKVYRLGPAIDSVSTEVMADCDCCGSDLAFLKDSSFIMAEYCIGDNTYSTGKYSIGDNQVILRFNPKQVTSVFEDVEEVPRDSDTSPVVAPVMPAREFQIKTRENRDARLLVSQLNSKLVLKTTGKDTDYGMVGTNTIDKLIKQMKEDSVWQQLQIK